MDANQRLEIESEDERERRIGTLLERTNNGGRNHPNLLPVSPMAVDRGGPDPHAIPPPSELLDRVRSFLPQLADSNAALSRQSQDDIDIENVGDDQEQYIELNLGLGVFEYRKPGAEAADDSSSELDSDSDPDSSTEDSASDSDASSIARPIKPLPKRKKPEIVVLGETSTISLHDQSS